MSEPFVQSAPEVPVDGQMVTCSGCRDTAPAGVNNCPSCGRLLPGHTLTLKHGVRRFETRGVLPADLRIDHETLLHQVIADQGGLTELTALRANTIRRLVDLDIISRLLTRDIFEHGAITKTGRTRGAVLTLMAVIDRLDRLTGRLGLERRTRAVNDIDVWLAGVQRDQRDPSQESNS